MWLPQLSFHWLYQGISARDWCIQGGLGTVLSQKQADGQYHPVTYGNRALIAHEKNYHSTKLEFPGTKVGGYGTFQRVLVISALPSEDWQYLLTYIMTKPLPQCHWSLMGWSPCKVQLPVRVPKKDVITLWQICWARLLPTSTQTWWDPFSME